MVLLPSRTSTQTEKRSHTLVRSRLPCLTMLFAYTELWRACREAATTKSPTRSFAPTESREEAPLSSSSSSSSYSPSAAAAAARAIFFPSSTVTYPERKTRVMRERITWVTRSEGRRKKERRKKERKEGLPTRELRITRVKLLASACSSSIFFFFLPENAWRKRLCSCRFLLWPRLTTLCFVFAYSLLL